MLSKNDEQLLVKALTKNQCVLFLGAGFSTGATNASGSLLPAGTGMPAAMWDWMGYSTKYGAYDGTSLDRLFDVARKEKGEKQLLGFLDAQLRVEHYPDWYLPIAYPYWYRIYTTNVDNLIERVFADARTTRLDTINSITSRYKERDAFLESLQYVKLNGSIGSTLDHVTFGSRQYAKRSSEYDAWYDQFVRDYSQHVTVLVGSQVNEPLFLRALEARQPRSGAAQELRLRSFLIADRITPVVQSSLSEFNVVPVETSAQTFLAYLQTLLPDVPERADMLMHVNPQRAQYLSLRAPPGPTEDALKAFFRAFNRVEVTDTPKGYRSLYHEGSTPDWQDLALGLDAQREITVHAQEVVGKALDQESGFRFFVVAGHRGSGKSTLLMRTALNLSAAGNLIFFAVGEDLPDASEIARAVEALDRRVGLFVDDAEWVGGRSQELTKMLSRLRKPPVLVFATRANALYGLDDVKHDDIWIGDLTDPDIEALIDVMTAARTLGKAAGYSRMKLRDDFRYRAKKQILVAMKEVTSGRDFNEIIRREYSDIEDPELRLTYLIACLATAAGASLTRGQLLSTSELPPALLLSSLERELNDVLVRASNFGDRVIARHSVIATTLVEELAPKPVLAEAYKRILTVLANNMDSRARRGQEPYRWFRLYKALIKHADIFRRFEKNIDEARAIFDALTPKLTGDAHYWLQYGSLELEYGELDFANRYINTAESLAPQDFQIRNAKGHLLLALARAARDHAEAVALRKEGEDVLNELIEERGDEDDYPWHILIAHSLDWIETWVPDKVERRKELQALLQRSDQACEACAYSDMLQRLRDRVNRAYLMTATEEEVPADAAQMQVRTPQRQRRS